jgi:hypothetical protein
MVSSRLHSNAKNISRVQENLNFSRVRENLFSIRHTTRVKTKANMLPIREFHLPVTILQGHAPAADQVMT